MKHKYKKDKLVFIDGYSHYDKYRTIPLRFNVSEAEKNFLDDLMSVYGIRNKSQFFRGMIFRAFNTLSKEDQDKIRDVAKWRAENDDFRKLKVER